MLSEKFRLNYNFCKLPQFEELGFCLHYLHITSEHYFLIFHIKNLKEIDKFLLNNVKCSSDSNWPECLCAFSHYKFCGN